MTEYMPTPNGGALSTQVSTRSLGFLRLDSILAPKGPLPISKSSWWSKVRSGEYPQPVKLGPRTTAWKTHDILSLIERLEEGAF